MVCKTKIYIFRTNCTEIISMEYFPRETHRNFNGRAYVENCDERSLAERNVGNCIFFSWLFNASVVVRKLTLITKCLQ